jgi:glycosyltransferase involved in cell wall biosynthesis
MFDIAFAPARESGWYRGKSALRYYEAAALGIPTIGSPVVYGEIEDGKTGFLADTPQEWEEALEFLIVNDDVRLEMGRNAREVALAEFDMNVRVKQWLEVIDEVLTES